MARANTRKTRVPHQIAANNLMTPDPQNPKSIPAGVSILARLIPSFSYVIAMLGAALSSELIVRTFQGMRNAETAGIGAVTGGLSAASQTMAIALYLAIFVGVIGIAVMAVRVLTTTNTASPSGWFFIITGGLSFIPIALLWKAQSLIIQAMSPGDHNVSQAAAAVQMCLTLTLITAALVAVFLLVAALVPAPAVLRAKQKYGPVIGMILIELVLVGMATAFQMRASWLYQVSMNERF